jgi:hypothetical protein
MFFENIAKSKNLCFLLYNKVFILVFFTIQNRIVQGVWIFSWILEKLDKKLINCKSFFEDIAKIARILFWDIAKISRILLG